MTQMTNQKKTELIDFFDLVGLKIHNFRTFCWKWKPFFSQNSPLDTKIPKRVQLFRQKFQKGSIGFVVAHPRPKISWVPPGQFNQNLVQNSVNKLYKKIWTTAEKKRTEGWTSFVLARAQFLSNSLIHKSFLWFEHNRTKKLHDTSRIVWTKVNRS